MPRPAARFLTLGMTTLTGMNSIFEPVLAELSERQRDEVLAAFAAVEHSPEPVPEERSRCEMPPCAVAWTNCSTGSAGPWSWSGRHGRPATGTRSPPGWPPVEQLPLIDRAVLTLVLIHSVAIPRTAAPCPATPGSTAAATPIEELQRRTQLPRGELRHLGRLRAAGLVRARPGCGPAPPQNTAYLPGPQFHRLTEAARRRLQEELILAAGPDTPLAAAIRRPARPGQTATGRQS